MSDVFMEKTYKVYYQNQQDGQRKTFEIKQGMKIPRTISHNAETYQLCTDDVEQLIKWNFAIRVNKSALFNQTSEQEKYDCTQYGLFKMDQRAYDLTCDLDKGDCFMDMISSNLK